MQGWQLTGVAKYRIDLWLRKSRLKGMVKGRSAARTWHGAATHLMLYFYC